VLQRAGGDADGRSELSLSLSLSQSTSTSAGCRQVGTRHGMAATYVHVPQHSAQSQRRPMTVVDELSALLFEDAAIDEGGATAAEGKNKPIHGHGLGHEFLVPLFM
ncbi:hypothetical protein PMIN01_00434, partial [Paraphaeosphaeria minitans]